MKISNDRLQSLAGAEAAADNKVEKKAGQAQAGPSADSLTLSPELRMLKATGQGDTVAVRADVVERMRQMLADGEIGNDASALADALIDSWLADSH